MWMRIELCRCAVCRPTRMTNPERTREIVQIQVFVNVIDPSLVLLQEHVAVTDCGNTDRVITAIFKPLEPRVNNRRCKLTIRKASEYSTQKPCTNRDFYVSDNLKVFKNTHYR